MKRAALVLFLSSCADPYAPVDSGGFWRVDDPYEPVESGAFWLVEVGPSALAKVEEIPEIGAFWIDSKIVDRLMKDIREGREGSLREAGRFDVPSEREVQVAVSGGFELRMTALPRAPRVFLEFRFSWSGETGVEGELGSTAGSVFGFLRAKPGNRYDLLMVAVNYLRP